MPSTLNMRPPVIANAILVIDAGTSALRAVSVTSDGRTTAIAREPWRMLTPEDAAPYGREFDPRDVLNALECLRASAERLGEPFAGVAFTGQREGLVFADERGDALIISPNVDARAAGEGIAIDAERGAAVYAATGHLPSLMQAPAKLAWLQHHRLAVASRVRYALPLADWLASRLTGHIAASRSLLAENGIVDVRSFAPVADDAVAAISPPTLMDGTEASRVRDGALAGLPVVLCGADTQCALVGVGAVEADDACAVAGWSAPVQLVTPAPRLDERTRTWAGTHVVPQRWVVESNAGETGRAWQWLLSLLNLAHDEAEALAEASPAGARDVMAVLGPARMDAKAMTASVGGITVPLPLVMSVPERGDVLRAFIETTAYAVRANLAQAEDVAEARPAQLRLAGGMAQSTLFTRILTDVVGRRLYVASSPETSALGAAALAAPALGVYATLSDALAAMVRPSAILEPDQRTAAAYDDYYERWLAMSERFESMS